MCLIGVPNLKEINAWEVVFIWLKFLKMVWRIKIWRKSELNMLTIISSSTSQEITSIVVAIVSTSGMHIQNSHWKSSSPFLKLPYVFLMSLFALTLIFNGYQSFLHHACEHAIILKWWLWVSYNSQNYACKNNGPYSPQSYASTL